MKSERSCYHTCGCCAFFVPLLFTGCGTKKKHHDLTCVPVGAWTTSCGSAVTVNTFARSTVARVYADGARVYAFLCHALHVGAPFYLARVYADGAEGVCLPILCAGARLSQGMTHVTCRVQACRHLKLTLCSLCQIICKHEC